MSITVMKEPEQQKLGKNATLVRHVRKKTTNIKKQEPICII